MNQPGKRLSVFTLTISSLLCGSFMPVAALEPLTAAALYEQGVTYFRAGDTNRAERSLLKSLRADPAGVEARLALATLYVSQQRNEDAKEQVQMAQEVAPDNPRVLLRKADSLLYQGEAEKAEILYQRVTTLAPDSMSAWDGWVSALRALGHEREAQRIEKQMDTLGMR